MTLVYTGKGANYIKFVIKYKKNQLNVTENTESGYISYEKLRICGNDQRILGKRVQIILNLR